MPEEKDKSESPWWLYIINGLVLVSVGIYFLIDYNALTEMGPVEHNPKGRKGQGLLLLLDGIFGKWGVLFLFGLGGATCLFLGYKGYQKKNLLK